ncbi:MAG: sulfatase-like hydrolase/transferase [Planctomycetes bacterium]|nr:sulfatase-like hydrolase/transferase [Planctomycetota bacterium]
MTDTQRKDMIGCYGNPDMKTPCLDGLAARGIRFDRAYCCQPVCGPARSALFTGVYPHSNGVWANSMPLGDTVRTLGQRLRDHGIAAAYIGKWHLDGGDYFGAGRCPDGWDPGYWYDMRNYLEELSVEDRLRSRQPTTNREGIDAEFTFGHRCSERAIRYLEEHCDDSFLLVLSYDEPHHPALCPEPYASMYHDYCFPKGRAVFDDLRNKPEHHRVWSGGLCERSAEQKAALELKSPDFLGCNSFVDSEIGRVLAVIDRLAPEALVIYTSDHGEMFLHHGMHGKGPVAYDDITTVPLIVHWPGHSPTGAVSSHPVSHIDVTPSLLDFFGATCSRVLEGRSLLDCFRDPVPRPRDEVFIEFGRYEIDHDSFGGFQPMRAVFDGRYKFVINLLSSDELYDLEVDPDEMINLIDSADHTAVRNRLHDRVIEWMNETRDPFRGYCWLNRPWRTDAPAPTWGFTNMTRQREEDEHYEPRQLVYETGLVMDKAVRRK